MQIHCIDEKHKHIKMMKRYLTGFQYEDIFIYFN